MDRIQTAWEGEGKKKLSTRVWVNIFSFVAEYPAYFQCMEQFSNSPYGERVNKEDVEAYFEPVIQVILTGIDRKDRTPRVKLPVRQTDLTPFSHREKGRFNSTWPGHSSLMTTMII